MVAALIHPERTRQQSRCETEAIWRPEYEKGRKYPVLVDSMIANVISMRKMLLQVLKQIKLYKLAEVRMGVRLLTVSFGRLNALFC